MEEGVIKISEGLLWWKCLHSTWLILAVSLLSLYCITQVASRLPTPWCLSRYLRRENWWVGRHCTWLQDYAAEAGSLRWTQSFMVPSKCHVWFLAALLIFPLSSFPKRKCSDHLCAVRVSLSMKGTWDCNNNAMLCYSGLCIKGHCCWLHDVHSLVCKENNLAWMLYTKARFFSRFSNLCIGEIVYRNTERIQIKYWPTYRYPKQSQIDGRYWILWCKLETRECNFPEVCLIRFTAYCFSIFLGAVRLFAVAAICDSMGGSRFPKIHHTGLVPESLLKDSCV